MLILIVLNLGCVNNLRGQRKSTPETAKLHHIIEFRKRDEIKSKGCDEQVHTKNSNYTKSPSILGLHGLLHVRSQKTKQETGTRRENNPNSDEAIIIKKPDQENGTKRSEELRKIQLRKETITMLHKIVEKYFPGGHLTVEQKIKALKILGKIIKLKKEGKNSDIKAILQSLSTRRQKNKSSDSILKEVGVSDEKPNIHKGGHDGEDAGGGDLYATIANGPDVPKLPPAVTEKDPEHANSNIMPVGFQHMHGDGKLIGLRHTAVSLE